MNAPFEAIEAAAMVLCEQFWDNAHDFQPPAARELAREVLEAAAPFMLAERAIAAVLELHREMECRDEDNEPIGGSYCEECKDLDDHSGERVHEVYPCRTVREVTASLAGAQTYTAMRNHIERMCK